MSENRQTFLSSGLLQ